MPNKALPKAPEAPLDKIEWRVDGNPTERNTARFVPYLNRAIVADLLDAWVGPAGWQEHYETGMLNGTEVVWATVSIRDPETGEWISRHDVGKPSNFEGEKGAVSDAFKRAASLGFGCGRNVYDLPVVWAPCDVYESRGKKQARPNAKTIPAILRQLKEQGYEVGTTRTGTAVADGGSSDGTTETPARAETATTVEEEAPQQAPITDRTMKYLCASWKHAVDNGYTTEEKLRAWMKDSYGVDSRKDLSDPQARAMADSIRKRNNELDAQKDSADAEEVAA